MEEQAEFLFAPGVMPELHLPDPRSGLYEEIAACWAIPVGQVAHVALRKHNFAELQGRIELAHAPELPFDRQETLALRIGAFEFSSRQIIAWSLA